MKNIICILTSIFCVVFSFAQEKLKYSYIGESKTSIEQYFEEIVALQINAIDGDYKSQRKEIYESQLKGLKQKLTDSVFIFNKDISDRIQVIFDEIYSKNPELQDDNFKFLLNKTMYPNASAYGNGMFTINLGLFSFFESEDEVAFVICHELAHHYLAHSKKSIDKHITKLNSKELKNKVKAVKRKRYGQNSAGIELLKDLSFDFSEHSRDAELEADAKGFEYFSKTKYNKNAFRTGLNKFGGLEDLIFSDTLNWESHFSIGNYHFKKHLLEKEQTLFDSKEVISDSKWDKDSLRSHPDTDLRIKRLEDLLGENIQTVSNQNYIEINNLSNKLSVIGAIDVLELDFALYLAATNIQKGNNDKAFYIGKIASILKQLYQLKKQHRLGKFIPLESDLSGEVHLNDVRRFMHNVDLYELKKIGKNYTQFHYNEIKKNDDLINAYKFFNN